MAQEIERKFLVTGEDWRRGARGTRLRQGYLSADPARTVRVRIDGNDASLTIKGPPAGITRAEFEYPIPLNDAMTLLNTLCQWPLVEKVRYRLDYAGTRWEIDEFGGENEGLVIAEVELDREDQPFERPPWLGREVTDDPRYQNSNLSRHPWPRWRDLSQK